ncbi:MAG: hypothetical protein V1813_01110 [Candidatus Aenigmatarchaeota archaeon]
MMKAMTSRYGRRLSGQSAFEFMFIFGVLLVATAFGMWVSGIKAGEVSETMRQLEIDDFLTSLSEKINTAWIEGEGFTMNATIPETIAGMDYTLDITSNHITLFVGEKYYLKQIIAANVTGTFVKGGTSRLTNTGDGILVS